MAQWLTPNVIRDVAFPILVALILLVRLDSSMTKLRRAIDFQTDWIKAQTAFLETLTSQVETPNHNTVVKPSTKAQAGRKHRRKV